MVWGGEFPYGSEGAKPPMLRYNPAAQSKFTAAQIARESDDELNRWRTVLLDNYKKSRFSKTVIGVILKNELSSTEQLRVDNVYASLTHVKAEIARREAIRKALQDAEGRGTCKTFLTQQP